MSYEQIKRDLLEMARDCYKQGPGWAQESVVLREFADKHSLQANLDQQQLLLTCWNDLFREGTLSWGYSIDNPNFPWYHFSHRESARHADAR